jgi:hypothetical protein
LLVALALPATASAALGRNVFVAVESHSTSAGVGPYWAY